MRGDRALAAPVRRRVQTEVERRADDAERIAQGIDRHSGTTAPCIGGVVPEQNDGAVVAMNRAGELLKRGVALSRGAQRARCQIAELDAGLRDSGVELR